MRLSQIDNETSECLRGMAENRWSGAWLSAARVESKHEERRLDPVAVADAALDRVVELQAEIDALTARRTEAIHDFEHAFDAAYPPAAGAFADRARRAELASR